MKKIYIILLLLIGIFSSSCTKNFEDFNTDKKHPAEVTGNNLFANAEKALADQVASTNVNLNIFKLISQYWTETTYTDEANYDIVNRTIADNTFRTYYRDVLADLNAAYNYISEEETLNDAEEAAKKNRLFIIEIVMAYCYHDLVDIFGNVPYTEALNIDNLSPVYDDGMTMYKDLITKLNAATDGMDATQGSFGSDDLYYGGDVSMWIKFANTLKVRMGIMLADVDPTYAQGVVEGAYQGAFAYGENCQLDYPGGTNSNPLYIDLVQSGRHDFVPANTIVDYMNTLEDPRRAMYFTEYEGAYKGGEYGYSNSFGQNSHIADAIQADNYPMVLLDYTELAFYLAEAAERGFGVGQSAEDYYNSAITSSFEHWGLTTADADAYLAKTDVAYSTASGTWREKIGMQAWLAYYIRGLVGFNSWRRLDAPQLNLPPSPKTDDGQVPKRFTFPINEQTLNADNYYQASEAVGGDLMSTKLFWDVN